MKKRSFSVGTFSFWLHSDSVISKVLFRFASSEKNSSEMAYDVPVKKVNVSKRVAEE